LVGSVTKKPRNIWKSRQETSWTTRYFLIHEPYIRYFLLYCIFFLYCILTTLIHVSYIFVMTVSNLSQISSCNLVLWFCVFNFKILFGFLCPPLWYYATILYFGNYYRKDPREWVGLGASAIAVTFIFHLSCLIVCVLMLTFSKLPLST